MYMYMHIYIDMIIFFSLVFSVKIGRKQKSSIFASLVLALHAKTYANTKQHIL